MKPDNIQTPDSSQVNKTKTVRCTNLKINYFNLKLVRLLFISLTLFKIFSANKNKRKTVDKKNFEPCLFDIKQHVLSNNQSDFSIVSIKNNRSCIEFTIKFNIP